MLSIDKVDSPKQIAAAQEFMREYLVWFFALVPGAERAPTFQGWEAEIASLPCVYTPPWDVHYWQHLTVSLREALP